jgi:hypothetical protein
MRQLAAGVVCIESRRVMEWSDMFESDKLINIIKLIVQ